MTSATSHRGRRGWGWGLAVLLGVALAVGGASAPAVAYDEGTIVSLVNEVRAENGLAGLVANPSLDAVALGWAQQLVADGTLSHNPAVGDQIPGGWTAWGENVAQGYASGAAVHDGWMNSPGHRANILGDFTDIGVALVDGGGTTWAVEVFAAYPGSGGAPPPAAPQPAPEQAPAPEEAAPSTAPAVAPPATPASTPTPSPTTAAAPSTASPTPSATTTTTGAAADGARRDSRTAADPPWWPYAAGVGAALLLALLALPAWRRRLSGGRGAR